MRAREAARMRARKVARLKLDEEMRPFRRAAADKNQTPGLLREVRRLLEIPVKEIAEKAGLERSGIYDIEQRELEGRAVMNSLARQAEAMDCRVVYGIVPSGGRTFEELYTERLWARLLGTEIREAGTEGRGDVGTEGAASGF